MPEVLEAAAKARRTAPLPSAPFIPTRRSFNNFNAAVESARQADKATAAERSAECDTISDQEMVQRFGSLGKRCSSDVGSDQIRPKKARNEADQSKRTFLKPKPIE
jgi:hypothetical protein